ncbi:MAG TPA: DUF1554 domain-containing protein [Candidatus Limnocylindrales bacterium]|nr:DUF1554 domain-containing protein [Candidatus Limnocylindrales bacterium]
MTTHGFIGTITVLAALCFASTSSAQTQSPAQRKCINLLNADASKIAGQQHQAALKCLDGAGSDTLGGSAQACLSADSTGAIGKTADKIEQHVTDVCAASVPDFVFGGAAAVADGGRLGALRLFADLFGSDLDAAAISCETSEDGCKCQKEIAKALGKLTGTRWSIFRSCKKEVLKGGAASAGEIARCVADPRTEGSVAADSDGKIAKGENKLAGAIDRCDADGVTAAAVAGGSCNGQTGAALAQCLEERAACRFCQSVNDVDDLGGDGAGIDCDLFDDGADNDSCAATLKFQAGASCSQSLDCRSGFCADAVCCDETCDGTCRSCVGAETGGADGTCLPVSADIDPADECAAADVATCGTSGLCDGAGACGLYPLGTICENPQCQSGSYRNPDYCDGTGTCIDGGFTVCSDGDVCTDDQCSFGGCNYPFNTAPCNDGDPCSVGDTCDGGGSCVATELLPNLRAAITKQLTSIDENDRVHLNVEITTLTDAPFKLHVTSLVHPTGFILEELESDGCVHETSETFDRYRCRHDAFLMATSACQGDGDYYMGLSYGCSPANDECSRCSGPETIGFTLDTENFCSETVVDTCNGDSIDPGEECDGADLGGRSCLSLGYFGGSLACNGDCSFNTAGCRRARTFITLGTTTGALGGLTGADGFCQAQASGGGLGGTYRAWLSTSAKTARERIAGIEYRLVDDTTVAVSSGADLFDGNITANITRNQFTGTNAGSNVWTGTNADGTAAAATCQDWTSASFGSSGTVGNNGNTATWTTAGSSACNLGQRLYCFEQLPYKRVFVTSTTTNGNIGGLAGGDAFCQARANAANLGGTWRAWLSTSTVDAKDRIPDAEYRLVNGRVVVANNKADLTDGSIDANIELDESGIVRTPDVWTGTDGFGVKIAGSNCVDWTNGTVTWSGRQGKNDFPVGSATWTSHGVVSCHIASLRLYCFEE